MYKPRRSSLPDPRVGGPSPKVAKKELGVSDISLSLRNWVKEQAEIDRGEPQGLTTEERERNLRDCAGR
jgi:hypothetical protein